MILVAALPKEFTSGEYIDSPAMQLRDKRVLFVVDGGSGWPGQHRNIVKMVVLETGHVVGWNENPSRGWSFPVKKGRVEFDGNCARLIFRDGSVLSKCKETVQ